MIRDRFAAVDLYVLKIKPSVKVMHGIVVLKVPMLTIFHTCCYLLAFKELIMNLGAFMAIMGDVPIFICNWHTLLR